MVKDALAAIRAMPADDRDLARPSREGWALWLWLVLRDKDGQQIFKRWRELALLECNAPMEKKHIADAIRGNGEIKDAPAFDLERRRGTHWTFSDEDPQASPYRIIRLSEIAGLPPFVNHMDVAAGNLKLAAESLSTAAPEMAARLVLRICTYDQDEVLRRVLSRTRVAALPADSARTLAEICEGVIKHALPRMSRLGPGVFWIERARVAMEVLSRLVLRLESDKAETVLDEALELYRNRQVAEDPWMPEPVYSLLKRSFEALPEERRNARIPDLLIAPIVGVDGFRTRFDNYPDPGNLLRNEVSVTTRTLDDKGRWQEMVSLLVRGLQAGGKARKRAAGRVASVTFREREAEASQIAQALWSETYIGSDGLPSETLLFDWVFFLLPEPESGMAERRFRDKWLTPNRMSQEDPPSPRDILWQVGEAIAGLKFHQSPLALSEDEQSYLIDVVNQWLDIPIPSHVVPVFGIFEDQASVLILKF